MSSSGLITGTTTTAEHDNTWTVTATDADGNTATLADIAYVLDMLGTPPAGSVSVPYSYTLTGSEGTAPYTFALTTGALPAGLTLSSAGLISGTPTTDETQAFTVTITDSLGVDQVKPYSIAIATFFLSLGPIFWARMDEGSGTVIIDSIAGNNGGYSTYSGIPAPTRSAAISEHSDGSITFGKVGGQVTGQALFDVATDANWSVCCTFKETNALTTVDRNIFCNIDSLAFGRMQFKIGISDSNYLYGYFTKYPAGTTESVSYGTTIALNTTYRVWLVRDGNDLILYVNGTEVDRNVLVNPVYMCGYSGYLLVFGNGPYAYNPNSGWGGPISDCAIFDGTVSAANIALDAVHFASL